MALMTCRKLEDKLANHKIELRPWTLNLNLEDLRKNREMPGAFLSFLGVADSTLPLRGTAHRVVRGAPESEAMVNAFCTSSLWLRQVLQQFPAAIPESQFVVPSQSILSHSERRNLTDLQETAQWLGGINVPRMVLKSLMSGVKNSFGTIVLHPTSYDGALELAAISEGMWVMGTSIVDAHFKASSDAVKNHLLQAWKQGAHPMDGQSKRHKKDVPSDDLPKAPELPELKLCQHNNGKISIPRDVRQHFMQCPVHGPEWRELLVAFDKDWGATPPPAGAGAFKLEPFDWATCFSGSPTTLDALKQKFGADLTEMVGIGKTLLYLAPGPQLYVGAKECAVHLKALEGAIVSRGAGSWLTGDKAAKFESNNPDRGIPCKIDSDDIGCIYEENSVDGPMQSLRTILQRIESQGIVDFQLGGHKVARPPDVQQGKAPDHFDVMPEDGNPLIWRPKPFRPRI
ncbi:unnamed protein product [Durusdinium trenchii]|uniref:Uncharacterized protein n=1 Tax=Durusdinium trenchii TaxID=1381693 RepID=A0ABP0RK65_9DINO